MFKKYQHIENSLSSIEVQGLTEITDRTHYLVIQPKLDGSNCSVWKEEDGSIRVGSRNKELGFNSDNFGSYAKLHSDPNIIAFFDAHPHLHLYGEWLAPHHVKYNKEAYNKFYIFDIADDITKELIPYPQAQALAYSFGLKTVPYKEVYNKKHLAEVYTDSYYNNLVNWLVEDGSTPEGIVVKNYFYVNPYGRKTWCKILHPSFNAYTPKIKHEHQDNKTKEFLDLYFSEDDRQNLILKTYYKVMLGNDFKKNQIGCLIQLVKYDLIKEYLPDYIINKKTTIDFSLINSTVSNAVLTFLREQTDILTEKRNET